MWLKSSKILASILEDLDLDDGKFHDIQVINEAIYIDGEMVVEFRGSSVWCSDALSEETLNRIFRREEKI